MYFCFQVQPIYKTAVPIELNKFSWSNVNTIVNKNYNIGYMYEEKFHKFFKTRAMRSTGSYYFGFLFAGRTNI